MHIPNVTAALNEQIDDMKRVAQQTQGLGSEMQTNWLRQILEHFGFPLKGWITELLQTLIILITVVLVICLVYQCLKKMLSQKMSRNSIAILKSVMKHCTPMPGEKPPAYVEI